MVKLIFLLLACAAVVPAQITQSLSCSVNAGTTPLLNTEGTSEAVGDISIFCINGVPTPAGVAVPQIDLTIYLNTALTSRAVSGSLTEVLLTIDEPPPATRNPCTSANPCVVNGVGGTGVNFQSGTAFNVFQAVRLGENAVIFRGIPVDPPGSGRTRVFRIMNLRANAHAIGFASTTVPPTVKAFLSVSPPVPLPIDNPEHSIGYTFPGLQFTLRTAANDAVLATGGKALTQCAANNQNTAGDPTKALTEGTTLIARFREAFSSSFKRRNIVVGASSDVFPAPIAQDGLGGVCASGSAPPPFTSCPANNYFTQTMFYMPALPSTNGLNTAGFADQGTRLMLRFTGVPAGVVPVVGLYESGKNASNSRVRLISTDAAGAGVATPVAATGTTPYAFAPVAISQGSGYAVWEVVNSDPLTNESIDIPVAVAYGASAGVGLITVTGSLAPIAPDAAIAPTPRFADVPTSATGVLIASCSACATIAPTSRAHSVAAEIGQVAVSGAQSCQWSAASDSAWLSITGAASGSGAGTINYAITPNNSGPRTGNLVIGNQVFSVVQAGQQACSYLLTSTVYPSPVTTNFGSINVTSNCSWNATSSANWVVVTSGTSGNGNGSVAFSIQGNTGVARNATLTVGTASMLITQPAGSGSTGGGGNGLRFVPVTPCRVVDTRAGQGTTGAFGPPTMTAGQTRSFPFPQGRCSLPSNAQAYSVNVTVLPQGALQYLTMWPTGGTQPFVSTLNSFTGDVAANAAIVPAGTDGAVSVFVTNPTDVVIDVNGYFVAPDAVPAGTTALSLYPVTPCRVVDTRAGQGTFGEFGPPSMNAGTKRDFTVPLGNCGIPSYAKAYAVNITVVPPQALGYLTAWPTGAAQPFVSTLNSFRGRVVANAAIVPAGMNGAISLFVANSTDVVVDINGYFAEGS